MLVFYHYRLFEIVFSRAVRIYPTYTFYFLLIPVLRTAAHRHTALGLDQVHRAHRHPARVRHRHQVVIIGAKNDQPTHVRAAKVTAQRPHQRHQKIVPNRKSVRAAARKKEPTPPRKNVVRPKKLRNVIVRDLDRCRHVARNVNVHHHRSQYASTLAA